MSLPDQTGKQVPQAKFKIREGYEWVEKTTDDFFKGKKLFSSLFQELLLQLVPPLTYQDTTSFMRHLKRLESMMLFVFL